MVAAVNCVEAVGGAQLAGIGPAVKIGSVYDTNAKRGTGAPAVAVVTVLMGANPPATVMLLNAAWEETNTPKVAVSRTIERAPVISQTAIPVPEPVDLIGKV